MATQPTNLARPAPTAATEHVRVGMVGSGFMAKTHSLAYAGATMLAGDALPQVSRVRIADVVDALAQSAARSYGWGEATTDWQAITRADDVDLVDVVTPNFAHAEIAIDAARHGKHVLCEKPLATNLEDARAMYRAVRDAGVRSQVGFVFRKWPAMQLAKSLIDAGAIGRPLTLSAHYFHDYALDPAFAISWRLRHETSGGGSVADIGSHVFDLARLLLGEVDRVHCRSRTIVPERPDPDAGGALAAVDVDDASDVLVDFAGGAAGVIRTNWMAPGYKTDIAFEVQGSAGTVRFSWTRNGELELYDATDAEDQQGFRRIIVGPQHPGAATFWPVAGQGLGYGDAFTILIHDLLEGLGAGTAPTPSFLDGVRAAEIVAAAQSSARSGDWAVVDRMPVDG
jgi:predicted dehydrogenase